MVTLQQESKMIMKHLSRWSTAGNTWITEFPTHFQWLFFSVTFLWPCMTSPWPYRNPEIQNLWRHVNLCQLPYSTIIASSIKVTVGDKLNLRIKLHGSWSCSTLGDMRYRARSLHWSRRLNKFRLLIKRTFKCHDSPPGPKTLKFFQNSMTCTGFPWRWEPGESFKQHLDTRPAGWV